MSGGRVGVQGPGQEDELGSDTQKRIGGTWRVISAFFKKIKLVSQFLENLGNLHPFYRVFQAEPPHPPKSAKKSKGPGKKQRPPAAKKEPAEKNNDATQNSDEAITSRLGSSSTSSNARENFQAAKYDSDWVLVILMFSVNAAA